MGGLDAKAPLDGIAIIGMACRFPGADSIEAFWQNLVDGIESVSFFSDEELLASGVDPTLLGDPHYVKAGAVLDDVDRFDASFFDISPKEAEIMDPQHRLFLECAWQALEDAGYPFEMNDDTRIGVYAGVGQNNYLSKHITANREQLGAISDYQIMIGNEKSFMPTRVSYKLGLTGPSVCVSTACSTSLVAVQTAYQSLMDYQCDIALAGAVSLLSFEKEGYLYREGMIFSPDGHCRAFDAAAQGIVGGNGVGTVALKRLEDAVADGDHIYAVIKGAAINNDGAQKIGYTAPSVDGQAAVIAEAFAIANIEPETVTYVEAHGTGTALGDPIEVTALHKVFQSTTTKTGFCAIGSVKTNFGHLDTAAGMAGLIKTALALNHKTLPPHLHFKQPNPKIDFNHSPFYVNTELSPWQSNTPRRAGVSSFGIGGTNAHVVLEEACDLAPPSSSKPWQLLPISAKTPTALETATTQLTNHLQQNIDLNLADVAHTLQVGRKTFEYRRVVLCQTMQEATVALDTLDPKRVFNATSKSTDRPVAFMFSGQGSQYVNMARDLYKSEPIFRTQVDRCAEILHPYIGIDLRQVMYPQDNQLEISTEQLKQTAITQPALFTLEYALAKLWMAWGVTPQAMIGHSIGEYVAACLAGVFSLEDALILVAGRGQMMQALPEGAMLSVALPEADIVPLLGNHLSLAVINGPSRCVVAGPHQAVDSLEQQLQQKGIDCRRLRTSHAFHSDMMAPILDTFREWVSAVKRQVPTLPFISNVTGTWITANQATDPDYWVNHLRQTVRFSDGLQTLLNNNDYILLEVGPGQVLSTLALRHPSKLNDQVILSTTRHPKAVQVDTAFLFSTLAKLWAAGGFTTWTDVYTDETRHRLSLPTYPFERQRYWIDRNPNAAAHIAPALLSKKADMSEWFYAPSWQRSTLPIQPSQPTTAPSSILIFADKWGLGHQLASKLQVQGDTVIVAKAGKHFAQLSDNEYVINPTEPGDYRKLVAQIVVAHQRFPETIIHSWTVQPIKANKATEKSVEALKSLGFYSLIYVVQAMQQQNLPGPCHINVMTNGTQTVLGDESLSPAKALTLGACKVIPQEYPNITCSSIDIAIPHGKATPTDRLLGQLVGEIQAKNPTPVVAYRGEHRWVSTFESIELGEPSEQPLGLKDNGVYLITGGLGNIGLTMAEYLAQCVHAKLVLTSRSKFPAPEDYSTWLASHDEADPISRKIRKIQQLQALGADVWVAEANVSNLRSMKTVITQTQKRFGPINGVIHGAGLVASTYIESATHTLCEAQFQAKVDGVLVLDKVLQTQQPDFCLVMSSISTMLGGLGFVTYAAANAFMDTFVAQGNQSRHVPWITVNWDAWQRAQHPIAPPAMTVGQDLGKLALTPQEGVRVLQRILAQPQLQQVIVSTGDLQTRVDQWITFKSMEKPGQSGVASGSTNASTVEGVSATAFANETERSIAHIWQSLLGVNSIQRQDSFFELGGDSLIGVQVVSEIERQLGQTFSINRLFQTPTIAAIAQELGKKSLPAQASATLPPCILPLKSGRTDQPPLFLVHAVGPSILFYQPLVERLNTERSVYGIQSVLLNGLDHRFDSTEAMAEYYIQQMKKVQPEGPYFVAGPSFGGFLAYEIARQLRHQGDTLGAIIIMDRATPDGTSTTPIEQRYGQYWQKFRQLGVGYFCTKVKQRWAYESHEWGLKLRGQQYRLYRQLKLPTDRLLNDAIYHHQVKIALAYQPRHCSGDVWVIRANDLFENTFSEQDMGWKRYVQGNVKALSCPGGHMSIFESPHVDTLAAHFSTILAGG